MNDPQVVADDTEDAQIEHADINTKLLAPKLKSNPVQNQDDENTPNSHALLLMEDFNGQPVE